MRWIVFLSILLVAFVLGGWWIFTRPTTSTTISPVAQLFEKPLEKYTIDRLALRVPSYGPIVLGEAMATTSAYTVSRFHFTSSGKKVTGLAHIPADASEAQRKPVIVQLRGYVERSIFSSGVGTRRSAEVFARNGFISLAPDFLGYGDSDMPSTDVFEERFQTYTVTLDLLAAVATLTGADASAVGIWAHSNGGQIALTVLEATGEPYPTTLWAPVTKPFPYSILYYSDESPDYGKALRKKLADFEAEYDVDSYTLVNFLDRIRAPLQLHQGTVDDAVPVSWNEAFVAVLQDKDIDIEYFVYPGADHNLMPGWDTIVARDIEFFRKHLR
jgi:dipeptidyl aminopeptidase/acylaminoacyl peptidase